jgi:phosphocarrier protein HPr
MSGSGAARRSVRIPNRLGLHARPAAQFVKLATTFKADVRVARGDLEVNGKSIMGVLMLAAEQGSELQIIVEGPDASRTADALAALVARGFDEE